MFCFFYKWMISRSLDSRGREEQLPALAARHIRRCDTCREFHRLSLSLAGRLAQDGAVFLQSSKPTDPLNEKIITALAATPAPQARGATQRRIRRPIPALAAALVVIAVAVGIIFQVFPGKGPVTNEDTPGGFPAFDLKSVSLPKIVNDLETPIETEMNNLGKAVKSAAQFVTSVVDIRIGGEG